MIFLRVIFTFLWIFTYELIAKIVVTFTNRYADTEGLTQKDYLCSMEYPLINFDSIEAFNNYYGLPTCNSFVSVFIILPQNRTGSILRQYYIVQIAKHRLASTTSNVAEIAYSLGFEYPAHFTRLFKRVTGISPSQFRKGCE